MLPKKERLKRQDFNRYFTEGKKNHFPAFTIVHVKGLMFQASAVVSKKVAKTAVQRNKLRRRIYAILRDRHKMHPLEGIYIVLVKAEALALSYLDMRAALEKAIEKLNK